MHGPKKIFLLEWSCPFHSLVGQKLQEKGWQIPYWAHFFDKGPTPRLEAIFKHQFSQTIFHHVHDILNFKLPAELTKATLTPLPHRISSQLYKARSRALPMLDRLSRKKMNFEKRHRHFQQMAEVCYGLLTLFRPTAIAYATIPHTYYDYIFYELAQVMGIHNLLFERSAITDQLLCFDNLERPALCLRSPLSNFDGLPSEYSRYLNKMKESEQIDTGNFFHRMNLAHKKKSREFGPMNDLKEVGIILQKTWQKGLFSKSRGTPFSLDGKMWAGKVTYFRLIALIKNARLRSFYQSRARNFSWEKFKQEKFVFYALHFQPERSTLPMGGDFYDQILALQTLSKALPENVKILVKEHPRQWGTRVLNARARSKTFYQELLKIPRLFFCPVAQDSDILMDHALAVATITGSSALEAYFKGRPSLVFGHPWYQHCPGIFQVKDMASCREALRVILRGNFHPPQEDDMKKFLLDTHSRAVHGYLEQERKGSLLSELPPEVCAENLAQAIESFTSSEHALAFSTSSIPMLFDADKMPH